MSLANLDKDRMDVVDFLINLLKDHEKSLDTVSARLVRTVETMEQLAGSGVDGERLNRVEELVIYHQAALQDDGYDKSDFADILEKILVAVRT